MDPIERKRIVNRIKKAERRLARGIDVRQEKYRLVSELNTKEALAKLLS